MRIYTVTWSAKYASKSCCRLRQRTSQIVEAPRGGGGGGVLKVIMLHDKKIGISYTRCLLDAARTATTSTWSRDILRRNADESGRCKATAALCT